MRASSESDVASEVSSMSRLVEVARVFHRESKGPDVDSRSDERKGK